MFLNNPDSTGGVAPYLDSKEGSITWTLTVNPCATCTDDPVEVDRAYDFNVLNSCINPEIVTVSME